METKSLLGNLQNRLNNSRFIKKLSVLVALFSLGVLWYFFVYYIDHMPVNEKTKTCLVTGASSGIGLEICREMVKRGWKVIGVARRQNRLTNLAKQLGPRFAPFVCDVSVEEQIRQTSDKIRKQGLKPTLFFLNAGTGDIEDKFKPFLENHRKTFATNYFGTVTWVEEWINDVKALGGGTFVATSSISSLFASPLAGGYAASKAAINLCFEGFRLQYRADNIGFVLALPGPVRTNMLKTDKPVPFTHEPNEEALAIVDGVFAGKKRIEPAWFYSIVFRLFRLLPDRFVLKFL